MPYRQKTLLLAKTCDQMGGKRKLHDHSSSQSECSDEEDLVGELPQPAFSNKSYSLSH